MIKVTSAKVTSHKIGGGSSSIGGGSSEKWPDGDAKKPTDPGPSI